MKLDFIAPDKLAISKANMRYAKKPPDVSDILPTIRARGILVPLIVRPNCSPGSYEIVAGARRFTAARQVAEERGDLPGEPLPCAILGEGDDVAAIEASLIENIARLAPDEVTRWETFARLVREGRDVADISATFGIPEAGVKRILALGNLLPRIRTLYRKEEINAATVRHLTLASKAQQKSWLALHDDPNSYCPTGHQLKEWLFGGASINVDHALFDVEASGLAIIADLFGDERYFADADAFWRAQEQAILESKQAYLADGWSDVVIVPRGDYFHRYDFAQAPKRKGGRIYIEVRSNGEVAFHEGYVTMKEARRLERGEAIDKETKPARAEVSSSCQTYIDLHRHAAVRSALIGHPKVALRLMVAHAIVGSYLWRVRAEPQSCRNDVVRESIESCAAEALFDERRRAVLALIGFDAEEPTVTGGNGDPHGLVGLFLRLLGLPDRAVMDVMTIVIGETLESGSAAVEVVGQEIGVDMAAAWQADDAFFECLRDRDILTRLVAEVAGEIVAKANAKEPGKVLKRIIRDHLNGTNGREKCENWVPKWMAFPPAAYSERGGIGTVKAAALVAAARADHAPMRDDADTGEPQQPQREAA